MCFHNSAIHQFKPEERLVCLFQYNTNFGQKLGFRSGSHTARSFAPTAVREPRICLPRTCAWLDFGDAQKSLTEAIAKRLFELLTPPVWRSRVVSGCQNREITKFHASAISLDAGSNGQLLPSRCSSNSFRHFLMIDIVGNAAASPNAQKVRPAILFAR